MAASTGLINLGYGFGIVPPKGEPLIYDVETGPVPQSGTFVGLTFAAFRYQDQWLLWVPSVEAPNIPVEDVRTSGIFNSPQALEKWAALLGHPTVYLGPATTPANAVIAALEVARNRFFSRSTGVGMAGIGILAVIGLIVWIMGRKQ